MRKARLLLADDHVMVLEGLTRLLEPEFEVVGCATDGRALVQMAAKLKPEVVIADVSMPLLSGIEAVRQATQQWTHPLTSNSASNSSPALGRGGPRSRGCLERDDQSRHYIL